MAAKSLQVEDLLSELEREGELDSSGQFTLDISQAAPKLAKFQLNDPFQYVLKLVQAAVCARAERFELRSGSTEVQCTFWGVAFRTEQLGNLLYYLLQDDQSQVDPALRHLAMGVNAAVGTRASEIMLRTWDGRRGSEVAWTRERNRIKEWRPSQGGVQTVFAMKRTPGDFFSEVYQKVASRDLMGMMSGDRQAMDAEQGLVYDQCAFTPIQITINGTQVPGYELGAASASGGVGSWLYGLWEQIFQGRTSVDPKFHMFEAYYPATGELGIGPPTVSHSPCKFGFEGKRTYQRILALPSGFGGGLKTRIVPIQDGVMLPQVKLDWSGPAGLFYVSATDFAKDLTSLTLVQGERLQKQLAPLLNEFLDCCERFLAMPPGKTNALSDEQRQTLLTRVKQGRATTPLFSS
jgi:hypothetical protein